jgi:hypothetical protein
MFNPTKSGKANFLGEGELVDDIVSGRIDLSSIKQDQLPEFLQTMLLEAQQAHLA